MVAQRERAARWLAAQRGRLAWWFAAQREQLARLSALWRERCARKAITWFMLVVLPEPDSPLTMTDCDCRSRTMRR